MGAHTKLPVSLDLGQTRHVDGKAETPGERAGMYRTGGVPPRLFSGRPPGERIAIARAFITKMVYDMATTRILRDRLETNLDVPFTLENLPFRVRRFCWRATTPWKGKVERRLEPKPRREGAG